MKEERGVNFLPLITNVISKVDCVERLESTSSSLYDIWGALVRPLTTPWGVRGDSGIGQ